MRPKFRAWDRTRNQMNYRVMVGNCDTDDENWTCPIIWIEERKDWLHFDDYECIMQSTGLFDKNGKEIFEGDIVSIDTDEFGLLVVKYETGIYWLTEDEQCVEHLSDYYKYVSVIGNIYENPELLEDVNETL